MILAHEATQSHPLSKPSLQDHNAVGRFIRFITFIFYSVVPSRHFFGSQQSGGTAVDRFPGRTGRQTAVAQGQGSQGTCCAPCAFVVFLAEKGIPRRFMHGA